jgi:hypothetical protein
MLLCKVFAIFNHSLKIKCFVVLKCRGIDVNQLCKYFLRRLFVMLTQNIFIFQEAGSCLQVGGKKYA